jgi:membrane protease YdiL (CAAX protease family)
MISTGDKRTLSRWDVFMLSVLLVYIAECCFVLRYADTVPKLFATLLQLFLIYRFGKQPHRVSVGLYSLFLPLALLAGVVGSYLARPSYFEFPAIPLLLSWFLLQLPVLIWCRKRQTAADAKPGVLPMLYVLALFLAYFWRLNSQYSSGNFLHYEYTPAYTWLCFILPQMVCCSASTRRLIRMSVTRLNWTRTALAVIIGICFMVGWDIVCGLLFKAAGLSVSLLILGPTIPAEAYANPVAAILDHLLLITGVYIYVALPEEVFFRLVLPGFLRDQLRARGANSFWLTFLLSSLIFGSVHWLQASHVWTKILYSCVSGMIFAGLRHYGRNIQAPAFVHAITNDVPRLMWG